MPAVSRRRSLLLAGYTELGESHRRRRMCVCLDVAGEGGGAAILLRLLRFKALNGIGGSEQNE